jgi:hypothetical protein
MDARVRRVREASQHRQRGRWLSAAARGEAVAYARQALGGGRFLADIARELAVAPDSLRRWLARDQAFRPVMIPASDPPAAAADGRFVLHTAGGHRLEGLTLTEAILALRALEVRA